MTDKKPPKGAALRAWCESNGVTPELVAEVLEVSTRTAYRIVNGERDVSRVEFAALQDAVR